jgi:hypothetical protein
MYPRVAGMVASHGPYNNVKEIYKLEGLTSRDKSLLKKYEKEFTANKAQYRSFNERINGRVST